MKEEELKELIKLYAANKTELDSYTEICEQEKAQIKQAMFDANKDKQEADEYVASRSVSDRQTVHEGMMLAVFKDNNIDKDILKKVIKTKEYVDMDALESVLYHNELDDDIVEKLNKCITHVPVVTLRVTKKKARKEKK